VSDTGIQLVSGADLKGAPYITALLNEPLNPALVKVHPQSKARYLDGRHYIETANRIFGYGGWQFRITERPAKAVEGTRKSGTYYALWSVVGELQAAGVTFVDLGTCEQNGEGPEAVDMASKGAVTDALKRCLRNFGDQFGLVLYDKELSYRDMAAAYSAAHGESQDVDPETGEIVVSVGNEAEFVAMFAAVAAYAYRMRPTPGRWLRNLPAGLYDATVEALPEMASLVALFEGAVAQAEAE